MSFLLNCAGRRNQQKKITNSRNVFVIVQHWLSANVIRCDAKTQFETCWLGEVYQLHDNEMDWMQCESGTMPMERDGVFVDISTGALIKTNAKIWWNASRTVERRYPIWKNDYKESVPLVLDGEWGNNRNLWWGRHSDEHWTDSFAAFLVFGEWKAQWRASEQSDFVEFSILDQRHSWDSGGNLCKMLAKYTRISSFFQIDKNRSANVLFASRNCYDEGIFARGWNQNWNSWR